MIEVLVCSLLMRIKGGFTPIIELRKNETNKIIHRLLDGKILSTAGFTLLCLLIFPWWQALLMGLAWLGGIAPSIGEEIGAIGGIKGNWPSDKYSWFGSKLLLWVEDIRLWGWLSGTLRGLYFGLLLMIASLSPWFLLMGAAFPISYFAGSSLDQMMNKRIHADFKYGEYIFGGSIGLCLMI